MEEKNMTNMISNTLSKLTTTSLRLTSYGLGLGAAAGMSELGFRLVENMAAGYLKKVEGAKDDPWGKQIVDLVVKYGGNPRSQELRDASYTQLATRIAVLAIAGALLHDAVHYFECKAPGIYNGLLQLTPIRVADQSVIESVKHVFTHFSVKELFIPKGNDIPLRFSTVMGKVLSIGARLGLCGIGINIANKEMELGYKFLDLIGATNYLTAPNSEGKPSLGGKIVETMTTNKLNPRGAENRDKDTATLVMEIAKLTVICLVLHELHHFAEGSAPKFYNTALSITPIRIVEGSILESAKQISKAAWEKPIDLFIGKAAV